MKKPAAGNRSLPVNLLVLLSTIVIMLSAAELCCRIFPPKEYSAIVKLHADNASGFVGRDRIGEDYFFSGGMILYHNYYFSQTNYSRAKDRTRIIFLGDSMTLGADIEDKSRRFTDLLQGKFDAGGYRIEVENFGVSGYNIAQISYVLHHVIPEYRPDIIVYNFYENDVNIKGYTEEDGKIITLYEYEDHIPYVLDIPFNGYLLEHSFFYRLINRKAASAIMRFSQDYRPRVFLLEEWNAASILFDMIEYCEGAHIPLYVIPLPDLHDDRFSGDEFIKETLTGRYDKVYYISQDISRIANASDIRVNQEHAHFNYHGHEIVADLLYRFFVGLPEIERTRNATPPS